MIRYLALMVFVLVFPVAQTLAQNSNDLGSKTKLVGYIGDFEPFNYFDKTEPSKAKGWAVDIVGEMARRSGFDIEYVNDAWPRVQLLSRENPNSLLFVVVRNSEREPHYHWFGPIAQRRVDMYRASNRQDITATDIESAKKYVVGVANEDAIELTLKEMGFVTGNNLMIVATGDQLMNMLLLKRFDLLPYNPYSIAVDARIQNVDPNAMTKLFTVIDQGGYWIALNKKSDLDVIVKLKAAYDDMLRDGTINKTIGKIQ